MNIFLALFLFLASAICMAEDAPVTPNLSAEAPSAGPVEKSEKGSSSEWSNHFQLTTITQTHGAFRSPYVGPLSLKPAFEIPTSGTSTLFVGHKLWKNAYVFVNPEESIGAGLSSTHGIAAFPNGEIYRVDDPNPKTNLSRLFIQQDIEFGGEKEGIEEDLNQFAALKDSHRITIVVGKFSLNDYLDDNTYSHDPRTQFMNWALMDTGAWDYAADTRGYTWGFLTELHLTRWSYKLAVVQVPVSANALDMDGNIVHAHAENAEAEYRYKLGAHVGKVRILGYMNQAQMGNYRQAINRGAASGSAPDIIQTRSYSTKYGIGLNLEQEITPDLGVFSRIGWNDGKTETWAFTEIDQSFSVGASLKGTSWNRGNDVVGLALMIDGLSKDHSDYLKAGGVGFIVGDGTLSYAPEEVLETYYSCKVTNPLSLSADFQFVNHPAYNSDRGPFPIFGLRVHFEI